MLETSSDTVATPIPALEPKKTNSQPQATRQLQRYRKMSDAEVKDMLSYLRPDEYEEEWLHIGMGLHDGGYSCDIWDEWSKGTGKYQSGVCAEKWNTFSAGNGITMGTVIHRAEEAGWPGWKKESQRAPGRLKPIAWEQLSQLPKREYLIKGLLDKTGMSTVFGESNCGKTFLAIDIAVHIASGNRWRGAKIRQGAVVYIAAEGGMGLAERLKAFHMHHKLGSYPPLHVIPAGIDLCNSQEDAEELIGEIQKIENVQLVVVDTLSRAMSGGNENSPDDMGAFIRNCDRIREETKAHVMIIHHSGKDSSKGARGHSALKAAVDTEIEVKKGDTGSVIAEITKQRDGETGSKFGFTLFSVAVGHDEDGDPRTSCILRPSEAALYKQQKLTGQKKAVFETLQSLILSRGESREIMPGLSPKRSIRLDDFVDSLKKEKITKAKKPDNVGRALRRIIGNLNEEGITESYGEYIWIPDRTDKPEA
jgi:hypothetical protein